jgi:uroporphyrinogen-III synthase
MHLLRIAERAGLQDRVRSALQESIVIVSIGPVMSDALVREGLTPDFAPNHPKLGVCIRQFSEQATRLVSAKRR